MWNPLKARRERQERDKRKLALAGKASSGNLTPGERARLFRRRRK